MARDDSLLHDRAIQPAALRIYAWDPPTISLGCFQRYAEVRKLPEALRGLPIVRRGTGGGAILHDREVTYCLVLDGSLPLARAGPVEAYRVVHACWRDALRASGGPRTELAPDTLPLPSPRGGPFFCFEKPGRTDLVTAEGKLLGSAQRRIAGRVLQHGSLMLGRRFADHPGAHLDDPPDEQVKRWIDGFVERLAAQLDLLPLATRWSDEQLADVAERRERFGSAKWTQRH